VAACGRTKARLPFTMRVSPASFVGGFFPTQILQGHNQIVLLNEWVAVPRRIYMDGRGHPPVEEMLPRWEGHSIGHWEGDTLVVDTTRVNGRRVRSMASRRERTPKA
jgi:hypothetical protein